MRHGLCSAGRWNMWSTRANDHGWRKSTTMSRGSSTIRRLLSANIAKPVGQSARCLASLTLQSRATMITTMCSSIIGREGLVSDIVQRRGRGRGCQYRRLGLSRTTRRRRSRAIFGILILLGGLAVLASRERSPEALHLCKSRPLLTAGWGHSTLSSL